MVFLTTDTPSVVTRERVSRWRNSCLSVNHIVEVNSIIRKIRYEGREQGQKSWNQDVIRFIDSSRIEQYDPVNTWRNTGSARKRTSMAEQMTIFPDLIVHD